MLSLFQIFYSIKCLTHLGSTNSGASNISTSASVISGAIGSSSSSGGKYFIIAYCVKSFKIIMSLNFHILGDT